MKLIQRFCIAAALAVAGACGGSDAPPPEDETETAGTEVVAEPEPEPEPEPPPPPSSVRALHAAAGAADQTLAGHAGVGEPIADFGELTYKTPAAYVEVPLPEDGGPMGVTFAYEGGEPVNQDVELRPGVPATVVVVSSADDPAQLVVTAIEDEAQSVTGQIRGRVINAMYGVEAIDVCLPGATRRAAGSPVFRNVAYGEVGGIPSFPSRYQPLNLAGVERIQIRRHSESSPCSGRLLGAAELPEVDFNVAHNMTMIAVGSASRRPRVQREVLFCEDAPAEPSCTAVQLR